MCLCVQQAFWFVVPSFVSWSKIIGNKTSILWCPCVLICAWGFDRKKMRDVQLRNWMNAEAAVNAQGTCGYWWWRINSFPFVSPSLAHLEACTQCWLTALRHYYWLWLVVFDQERCISLDSNSSTEGSWICSQIICLILHYHSSFNKWQF